KAPNAMRMRSHLGGSAQPLSSVTMRAATAAPSSTRIQSDRCGTCGTTASASPAITHESLRPNGETASTLGRPLIGLKQRERRQASLSMRGADIGGDVSSGKLEPERMPRGVGILDPATKLRKSCFHAQTGEHVPIEDMGRHFRARIELHLQTLVARISLPRDARWGIAGMEAAQTGKILVAAREILRAAGVGLEEGRRLARRARARIDDAMKLGMEHRPRAEQSERMARRELEIGQRKQPALVCRQFHFE